MWATRRATGKRAAPWRASIGHSRSRKRTHPRDWQVGHIAMVCNACDCVPYAYAPGRLKPNRVCVSPTRRQASEGTGLRDVTHPGYATLTCPLTLLTPRTPGKGPGARGAAGQPRPGAVLRSPPAAAAACTVLISPAPGNTSPALPRLAPPCRGLRAVLRLDAAGPAPSVAPSGQRERQRQHRRGAAGSVRVRQRRRGQPTRVGAAAKRGAWSLAQTPRSRLMDTGCPRLSF